MLTADAAGRVVSAVRDGAARLKRSQSETLVLSVAWRSWPGGCPDGYRVEWRADTDRLPGLGVICTTGTRGYATIDYRAFVKVPRALEVTQDERRAGDDRVAQAAGRLHRSDRARVEPRYNRPMKHIVITGASGGIGAALAAQLGAAGHRVALAARREPELREAAARAGHGAIAIPADVTRRADVEQLRDRAIEAFGHIDVWVNNAGRGINRPVLELTDEELDLMLTVNVKSALYGMQAIAPHFIARGRGQIVNVSSMLSRVPFATFRSAYNAAKAALNALTANARVDLAREHPGIQVTLVMPGLVRTDFQRNAVGGSPPMPALADAQSVEDAAAAIAAAIEHPVAEIYTNPRHAAIVQSYFQDVGAFERQAAAARG